MQVQNSSMIDLWPLQKSSEVHSSSSWATTQQQPQQGPQVNSNKREARKGPKIRYLLQCRLMAREAEDKAVSGSFGWGYLIYKAVT